MILGGQPTRYPFRAAISGFRWKRLGIDVTGIQKVLLRTSDLAEAVAALVLARHPHNYTDDLRRLSGAAAPRIVREAEYWMRTGGSEISVSKVAARVGVSLRSLEAGFREWRQSTPTQYLRKIRLEAARGELLAPSDSTSVTSVALGNGFFHLARFSAYYRVAFGETPGQTLRRSRFRRGSHFAVLGSGAASAGRRKNIVAGREYSGAY